MTAQENRRREAMLRAEDHDRDLHHTLGTLTAIERPTPHLLRFTAVLDEQVAADPAWRTPNVTLRMELGPRYDDASRVYTVRRFLPEQHAIEVDVVVHGSTSPMMRWVADLALGDTFGFRGPRQHFVIPAFDDRPVALFLDGTAIPALFAILEQWPVGRAGGIGWVETADIAAFDELPTVPGLELRRIDPAEGPDALASRAWGLTDPGQYVVWGAGERDAMRALRQHFRNEVGLAKEHVALFGYWKRSVTSTQIDQHRLDNYATLLAGGGGLEDIDDLAIEM